MFGCDGAHVGRDYIVCHLSFLREKPLSLSLSLYVVGSELVISSNQ